MSAIEVIGQAAAEGMALSLSGGRLTWKANRQPSADLLDRLRAHKQAVIDALAANDYRAAPPSPQPIQGQPEPKGARVWRVVVDGKGMTVIDPHRRTLGQMQRDMAAKFGLDRVMGVERIS